MIIRAKVTNEEACRVMCYMEPNCVSINVGPLEEGQRICELNNATDEDQFVNFLEEKPSFTYSSIIEVVLCISTCFHFLRINLESDMSCKLNSFAFILLNRIPAATAHARKMAPVRLDSPVKVFVVSVNMDSLGKTASLTVKMTKLYQQH